MHTVMVCHIFFYNYRGPNVKFVDDEIINRLNCYCHLLNNVIQHMCEIESVKSIIDKVSSLVSYVCTTGLGVDCDPQLSKYVESRWHTVHDMLESVSLNYATLSKILLAKEEADRQADVLGKLTCFSRMDLDVICEFLHKFKTWMKHLESDQVPTIWMVWPTFISVNKHLHDSDEDHHIIQLMKRVGREYLSCNKLDFEPKMIHKIGSVLHPMLKNIAIASSQEKEEIYSHIDTALQKLPSTS